MNLLRDDSGYAYYCVSEVNFGDVIVEWCDYVYNMPAIKNAGGKYVTIVFDSKTGKFLIKKHYRNDYMRAYGMSKLIAEAKKLI